MIDIDLAGWESDDDACLNMAAGLHAQLSNGYTRDVSCMPLVGSFDEYLATHRTARKRAARAERLGYRFARVPRDYFEDDIFAINTSTMTRQGRPMTDAYGRRQSFPPERLNCTRHHVYTYGVLHGARLYAYLWLYRCGELALVSSILGHAAHLENDVMYLLATRCIDEQLRLGGTLVYNLHTSGTDGLRYFKERLGLTPTEVAWQQ